MDSLLRDLRFALRMLAKKPVYTVAALLALGLGVGANTAIFSVFDAVLLAPLAYPEADRLVRLWESNEGKDIESSPMSPVTFDDVRDDAKSFAALAGWWYPDLNLTSGEGEPHRVAAINVTDDFFDVMGVAPAMGRGFAEGDDEPGKPRIAVISHALWQKRWGGDPDVLGKAVTLDDVDYELVGVMPPGFSFPGKTELWLPLGWDPAQHSRFARFFGVVGRLAGVVDEAAARAEVETMARGFARDYPRSNEGWGVDLRLLRDDLVGDVRPALWVLLGAVAFVLLIACANVANLLLAQAAAREKEVAVRSAIGAGRGRLLAQFLTESLVLGLCGGLLGLGVAFAGVRLLVSLAPPEIPRLEDVAVDAQVLLFAFGVAVVSSLVFGLAPALHSVHTDSSESLKEGGRGASSGAGGRRLRQALVVSEVALALVLLFGAGLLVRSFYRLLAEDTGFRPERTLSFNLQVPFSSYGDWTDVVGFYDRLMDRLETEAGVRAAAVTAFLPLEAGWRVDFALEGEALDALNDDQQPEAQYHIVSPGYFQLMGVPLQQGRDFDDRDLSDKPGAVILSRAAVDRYWGGESPVGEKIQGGTRNIGPLGRVLTEDLQAEVVGVVGDVKNTSLEEAPEPAIYFPHRQFAYRSMNVVLRGEGDPASLKAAVKSAVWDLDAKMSVAEIKTLEEHLGAAVARRRFVMLLLACFAGLSLALAAIGTYGVMSYVAGERRREMGIRVALGARRADVVGLLVGQGLRLVTAGVVVGVAGALAVRRLMTSLVYGVSTGDGVAFGGVVALLAAAALLACYLPARRAARTDPVTVLREE
jgi:predicted permease